MAKRNEFSLYSVCSSVCIWKEKDLNILNYFKNYNTYNIEASYNTSPNDFLYEYQSKTFYFPFTRKPLPP